MSATATPEAQASAIKYLNEFMFNETYVDALIKAGSVPVTNDAEAKIKASDQAEFLGFAYGMVKDAPSFQLSWDQALPATQAQALLTNLSQVFLKKQTPQQFVDSNGRSEVSTNRGAGAQAGLRTGPSIWLAAPAMTFFAIFALIPSARCRWRCPS